MKKLISTLLILTLMFSLGATAFAQEITEAVVADKPAAYEINGSINVSGTDSFAVDASNGAVVSAAGDVYSRQHGVLADNAEVTVEGSVRNKGTAVYDRYSGGAVRVHNGKVTVTGDIDSDLDSCAGNYTEVKEGSLLTVGGNVSGKLEVSTESTVIIRGDLVLNSHNECSIVLSDGYGGQGGRGGDGIPEAYGRNTVIVCGKVEGDIEVRDIMPGKDENTILIGQLFGNIKGYCDMNHRDGDDITSDWPANQVNYIVSLRDDSQGTIVDRKGFTRQMTVGDETYTVTAQNAAELACNTKCVRIKIKPADRKQILELSPETEGIKKITRHINGTYTITIDPSRFKGGLNDLTFQ